MLFSKDFSGVLSQLLAVRSLAALLIALFISMAFGVKFIKWLAHWQHGGQPIREDGPASHLISKKGTPTIGGLLILLAAIPPILLLCDIRNAYIWIILFVTLSYALLGFTDDYLKISKKNSRGLKGKIKLFFQFLVAFVAIFLISLELPIEVSSHLTIPFAKNFLLDLGWFFLPFAAIVIVGTSNAVNLTDGLDGLASGTIMIALFCFAIVCFITGNINLSYYFGQAYIPNSGELLVVCSAFIGAALGFLWFNAPPAKVFMGDTGSLALGGLLGTLGVITKHEIFLSIIGGVFVIEAISVIIQVYYFKFTKGKRFFAMAPIHHHFEKQNWPEAQVVIRFWILAIIFAIVGFSSFM